MSGASTTFQWTAESGATGYFLWIGSAPGTHNLANLGEFTTTSATVSLPTSGATIYVRLWSVINGTPSQYADYTYTEANVVPAAMSSPLPGSTLSGASTTFSWTAGSGVTGYYLWIGTAPGGHDLANQGQFTTTSDTVNLPTSGATIYVRLWSVINGRPSQYADYTYTETSIVPAAMSSPLPGSALSGTSTTFSWTAGSGVTGYYLWIGTAPGAHNVANLGQFTTTVTTVSVPVSGATIYVRLWSVVNGRPALYNDYSYTETSPPSSLASLSCASSSTTGAESDTCAVTLNSAAGSGGLTVSLASSNGAVAVPASVTVPAGATSSGFTANIAAVSTAQTATLIASAGGASKTLALQLNAAIQALTFSATSLSFGNLAVNTPASQSITLSSTGTVAVTVNSATMTGAGFSVSGITFPTTLNPGQTATLSVQFDPTVSGAASGQLTVSSDSSQSPTTAISLSGAGVPVLSAFTCANSSMTGAGTDACTLTLNTAAPSGGTSLSLSSSNPAVTVPAAVTVAAGSAAASFLATATAVSTSQADTLTASAGGVTKTFAIQLNVGTPTLNISTSTISFGDVTLETTATQSITLSSSGTTAVTVSSAALVGTGFSLTGITFPVTLNPGQSVAFTVAFDPTTAGSASGTMTICSNSSTNSSAIVTFSGTGVAASYQVNLNWNTPSNSPDPVAGYNVYRAASKSGTYQLLNASPEVQPNFMDSAVKSGKSYYYVVKSVDSSGVESAPSSVTTAVIP